MVAIIKDNLAEIVKTCRKMHVRSLYLFGSAINENKFSTNSDLDFVYQFKKDKNGLAILQYDYFDLMFELEKITGKKIDLVAEEKIKNKIFLARLNQERIKIYES